MIRRITLEELLYWSEMYNRMAQTQAQHSADLEASWPWDEELQDRIHYKEYEKILAKRAKAKAN